MEPSRRPRRPIRRDRQIAGVFYNFPRGKCPDPAPAPANLFDPSATQLRGLPPSSTATNAAEQGQTLFHAGTFAVASPILILSSKAHEEGRGHAGPTSGFGGRPPSWAARARSPYKRRRGAGNRLGRPGNSSRAARIYLPAASQPPFETGHTRRGETRSSLEPGIESARSIIHPSGCLGD